MREIKFRAWDEFPKYEIGDDGTVFSLDYNHTGERKELKQYLDDDGYAFVFMVVSGKRYKRTVHRLVAITFIGNPFCKKEVNHKNGIKTDNRVENLEWNTHSENTTHSYRVLNRKRNYPKGVAGERNPNAKLSLPDIRGIKDLRQRGCLLKQIAQIYRISIGQVSSILNGRSWK